MSGKSEDFLAERGLGPVERRLRLGGRLSAAGAGELPAELCLTPQGAWLVAADGRFVGHSIEVTATERVKYERGSLRDHLLVDGRELSVPAGRGAEARRSIALGRLRRELSARSAPEQMPTDRFVQVVDEPICELAWRSLGDDDLVIGLCRGSEGEMKSALGASVRTNTDFVLSAERAFAVTLSELGDRELVELDASTLHVEPSGTAPEISDGKRRLSIGEKSRVLFSELFELARLPPAERLCEAARRLWLARDPKSLPERPTLLVRAAERRGLPLAGLLELSLRLELARPLPPRAELSAAVAAVKLASLSAEEVTRAFRRWQFSRSTGRELVAQLGLLGSEAEPCALAIHRAAYETLASRESETLVLWDVELAEHELRAGEPARAGRLAEARLKALAPDEDAVLAPERATPAHVERVRLYEILNRAAVAQGGADVRALSALARLEPSSEARLLGLARANSQSPVDRRFIARAERALSCLAPAGLAGEQELESRALGAPLDRAALDQRVRHPLARGGRLATRLSELIASVPEPDLGFLRDFCEELTEEHYPDPSRALGRAVRLLGLPAVAAYVSHGARSIGMRAFGSGEPFVLIGERHLSPDGPYALRGAELDFALGAELCHLAFGHQRVTAGEVWAGAAGKTRDALVLLGFVVPMLAELGGPRAQRLLGRLSAEALERAAGRAARLPELFGRNTETTSPALGQRNEELIAAHRLVQLTADRGGLVVAGDLAASLRAVLLTRADYREVLDATQENGLLAALAARRTASPAFADLLLRVRVLIAFYLSPDFDALESPERAPPALTS
jgi:hypothetical protein